VLPEGGVAPPGKFRREKYQRGDQGKNRQKFTPPPPGKFRRENLKVKFNSLPLEFWKFSELGHPLA
jgi:hypothetical protein